MSQLNYLPSKDGFLGLAEQEAGSLISARGVVIPFALEQTVSYGTGTAKGPAALLSASHQVELFDEEFWCEPVREFGVSTLKMADISQNLADALNQLEEIVRTVLDHDRFPLVIGGEHALTAGATRPFAEKYQDLVVLHFDAHADLRDGYEGQHFSHAAAMRRVLDFDHVSLVSVGIRNISSDEIPFFEANKERITIHWAKDKWAWDVPEIIAPLEGKPIYVTFDLDGFDSSLMPATGTPEPGGLFFQETLDILRSASQAGTIVGADVVELAPIPGFHACDFLAAKLAYKILTYALLDLKD